MADNIPIAASGPREPVKRPKPIPKVVKAACLLMVYGAEDDEDGAPVDFITAAKTVGMRPDTLRRYLSRPQVIAYLRAERRTFRDIVLAGQERALQMVRDGSGHSNPMARVAAARALSGIEEADPVTGGGARARSGYLIDLSEPAGLTIRIVNPPPEPVDTPGQTIDVTPNEPDSHSQDSHLLPRRG